MRRLALLLLAASLPAPAWAVQQDPHAGHASQADQVAQPEEDPHAGHAGHDPQREPDPHAGHDMAAPAPAVAPPSATAGPEHAADALFGAETMARARERLRREHGAMATTRIGVDRLEAQLRPGRDGFAWEELHLRRGGDIDRLLVRSDGEGDLGGGLDRVEVQALWSRAIAPFFDLQAGLRHDFRRGRDRSFAVVGVDGLAPYRFDVGALLFVSDRGAVSARVEAAYDLRLTQRLVLQPRAEVELAASSDPALGVGSGLSAAEAGLRLRYELVPEFASYVGVEYERAFAGTARFRRGAGEDVGGWSLVLGVRTWF